MGLRLLKPPYGRITGYDMNAGTIAFQIPNGDTPANIRTAFEAAGVTPVPQTGSASQAHLLVTKNFLFATEGSGGQAILHAYDKKTGAPIWQGAMPGPATGIPMAYVHQNRPFIVHAARGPQGGGAQIVAWSTGGGAGAGGRGGGAARGGGGAAPARGGGAAPRGGVAAPRGGAPRGGGAAPRGAGAPQQ
jgi:hypothetical protein